VLRVGMRADFVRWRIRHPAELCYWLGGELVDAVHIGGSALPRFEFE
jgi:imidazolonepropionase